MSSSAMGNRQTEVEELLYAPIYKAAKELEKTLGYPPPIFQPGKPAIQDVEKTELLIVMSSTTGSRRPETIAGTMWVTERVLDVNFWTPERIPNLHVGSIHPIVERVVSGLVDDYSNDFCRNDEQVYITDVRWESQIDVSNRTSYVIRMSYRFYEYPMREAE